MKLRTAIILLILIAVSTGCKDIDELLTFTISDQTTFTVESASPLNLPLEIATPDVTTNSSQKFENNNTTASLVKDVKLEELRLTIISPSGKTFSFLESVHLYISTGPDDEIALAHIEEVPAGVSAITLITTTEKLDKYVKASSYKLRTSVVTRETLTEAVDIRTDLKFKVTAAPL